MARMYRIAISGHRGLGAPTVRLVDEAIRAELARHAPDVSGISYLAYGADQIFARGHRTRRYLRSRHPRRPVPGGAARSFPFRVRRPARPGRSRPPLPFTESTPESHMAASKLMVDEADELCAVWDGEPARSYGGTADVVAYARERGIPVRVIWPSGAQRD